MLTELCRTAVVSASALCGDNFGSVVGVHSSVSHSSFGPLQKEIKSRRQVLGVGFAHCSKTNCCWVWVDEEDAGGARGDDGGYILTRRGCRGKLPRACGLW